MKNFETLTHSIQHTHNVLQQEAVKAVNISLTVRNWLVGFYIVEFEQNGEDRAQYGKYLLQKLAERLNQSSLSFRNLKLFRQFYQAYPQFGQTIAAHLINYNLKISSLEIGQTPFAHFKSILDTASPKFKLEENNNLETTVQESQKTNNEASNYYKKALQRISFSHFVELLKVKDATQRQFYELLILKTQPSVTQLKNQINSLAFERVGLSKKVELGFDELLQKIEPFEPAHSIKTHYIFDFLKLGNYNLIEESTLEQALINHLQEFIVELGNGFCFEARQKKILIDQDYYFVDLVFYHRILKCHVLIELKADQFKHEHLSQLNTYVSYYREEIKQPDDNPPIGILLCTQKGKKLVEYAFSGMDEKLFVSKYLVQLPSKETLQNFLEKELKKLE
ncbi:MAG TPA: cytoplasmic protein [Flavobacterium sp.]|nr:cytoplasmic protein [Flavobacterium sp.]